MIVNCNFFITYHFLLCLDQLLPSMIPPPSSSSTFMHFALQDENTVASLHISIFCSGSSVLLVILLTLCKNIHLYTVSKVLINLQNLIIFGVLDSCYQFFYFVGAKL